ncbi:unnamed protein product [Rotaria socialis]|uniref:F-box domain-containing protein n=1 Tax=Rotaria socialis TaxID=392032 RepID=A0A820P3K8_9BILA|nr:unnamed protein product [Rotaria socialis]
MSIASIENLSNEVFYEIFAYFDGLEFYEAFSNLNHRFQQLLNSSILQFKIVIGSLSDETYMNEYEQLARVNRQQIASLCVSLSSIEMDFFSLYPIDLFVNLESLILNGIPSQILFSILTDLTYLSRLRSLNITTEWESWDLTEIYRLVFTSRNLTYFACSSETNMVSLQLPVATNEQLTTIARLIIDHSCNFNDLSLIVSYTPQLRYLHVSLLDDENYSSPRILPIGLFNLTHFSIESCEIKFDEFKLFIRESECNLKFLRINIKSHDRNYLDADQWENLISECLPQLEIFQFKCSRAVNRKSVFLKCYKPPHPCTSLFWIEHRWTWEVEMDSFGVVYWIRLYKSAENNFLLRINDWFLFRCRDRWYDGNSSIELSKSTLLTITSIPSYALNLHIRDILIVTPIYNLEILDTMCSITLTEIINYLPALDSLKISSLTSFQSKFSSCTLSSSKITKVYFQYVETMEEIVFIFKLCPCLTYLKVDIMNEIDYKSFLKDILPNIHKKCNQYLRSICLHLRTIIDNELFNKIYDHQKLRHDYTIERDRGNIYLHRK